MLDVEIRIKGQIDADWSEWLGGLIVIPTGGSETHLVGRVRDQAMLRGLLNELADLGLDLISVTTLPQSEEF
ncbi:MAG: hypothetical protein A2144_09115 [Chloroflexi bacterium RBG_16_50_9]|nr:MAG: hypothetical protein A2144_09115 [Chloroflexi bacterium RBG_16_50_9]